MTPVFKKMNVKDQESLTILNPADSFKVEIEALKSYGQSIKSELDKKSIEWILIFVQSKAEVLIIMPQINQQLIADAMLWFAYPKKSSKKYSSDISRDDGWQPLGVYGWEGVRQVAIDEDWRALRFRRVEHIKNISRSSSMAMTAEAKKRTTQK